MRCLRLLPQRWPAAILGIASVLLIGGGALRSGGHAQAPNAVLPGNITIDYPLNGSVFPPEITSPTFLWRDASATARHWVVEVSFADHSGAIRVETAGEHMQRREVDHLAGEPEPLTPEQAATRTWKPDAATWARIKQKSVNAPATVTISGFTDGNSTSSVSRATVTISTSRDTVGAPIF
jgi:hypothetical protein